MNHDVVAVEVTGPGEITVTFDDGTVGAVRVADVVTLDGVFGPLKSPDYFRQVRLNREIGTVVWPSGADLCPDVLYEVVRRPD